MNTENTSDYDSKLHKLPYVFAQHCFFLMILLTKSFYFRNYIKDSNRYQAEVNRSIISKIAEYIFGF